MNSHVQFGINHEVDPLSISIEQQEMKTEIKTEAEDCDIFGVGDVENIDIKPDLHCTEFIRISENIENEIKTETEECDKFIVTEVEFVDVKPFPCCVDSIENITEVDNSKECFYKSLKDYEKKPQDEQKNAEVNGINAVNNDNDHQTDFTEDLTSSKVFTCVVNNNTFTELREKLGIKSDTHRSYQISCENKDTVKTTSSKFNSQQSTTERNYIHSGVKHFTCDFCRKSFYRRSVLIRHVRIHIGEKFVCKICSKSFSQKNSLNVHNRLHTGEKLFTCDFCSKSFLERSVLTAHKLVHTGEKMFVCNYCGKSFLRKSNLIVHQRVHSGEKRFTCNICNKSFSRNNRLATHLCLHSDMNTLKILRR